ncbi:LANO_0G06612g1_1 [Lachancea nothofagi CBS 11611]|uniref:2-dehydropantoate 2-reductase n=1 Tax=Lachancea nothofagi CBS 11611 TaxID=1266666 RepID=A0A1G4KH70_9SACH|nr:LANO_0G06612g1_1 [Lachancea nothofagi CBS 11611]
MTQPQPKVFILGFGSIGVLLASHLQRNTQISIVPLLRSEKRLQDFEELQRKASIKSLFKEGQPSYESVFSDATCPELFPRDWKIDNLIITTKTYQTKDALAPFMKFLHPQTNVMLVQNGLGVFEVLNDEIFLDYKPNLFQGVISHGIFHESGFSFNHAGFGDLKVSRLPSKDPQSIVQTKELVETDQKNNELVKVLSQPDFIQGLNVKHLTYQEMLLGQLEKFLVNACINPITSIVDCINGELRDVAGPIFSSIISEALDVLKIAYKPLFDYKPENDNFPNLDVAGVLNRDRMLDFVLKIGCIVNGTNSSSMRQDVVNLRETEVDYINGYIVKLCGKLGLGPDYCKTNQTIETLVKLRLGLNRGRAKYGDQRKKE